MSKEMISDLPLCDRLSIKGKLFELQKKLQLIDLEQKLDEQYSYTPNIINYDLPNRQPDFFDNIHKAGIIRKVGYNIQKCRISCYDLIFVWTHFLIATQRVACTLSNSAK
jgi:hypothetical protein